MADVVGDAESIFASLAVGAVGGVRTTDGIVAVVDGIVDRVAGIIVGEGVGEAGIVTAVAGVIVRRTVVATRSGTRGIVVLGGDAGAAPAEAVAAIVVGLASRRALSLVAEGVLATVVVIGAGDLTVAVVADAAVAAIAVDVALTADDAASVVADLTVVALHVRRTLGDAVAVEAAEFFFEALVVGLAPVGVGAGAVVALTGRTVAVAFAALADLVGYAVATGGADEVAVAVLVDGTDGGTGAGATDLLAVAVLVDRTDAGTIIVVAFIAADVVLTGGAACAEDDGAEGDQHQGLQGIAGRGGPLGRRRFCRCGVRNHDIVDSLWKVAAVVGQNG